MQAKGYEPVMRFRIELWGRRVLCAGVLWLVGCGSVPKGTLVLEPVGPVAGGKPSILAGRAGYLTVYTATEPYNDGGFVYHRHTPYSVYSAEGNRVKGVVNRTGMTDQRPMTVSLPAGRYRVYAPSEGYGLVEVPVTIVASRETAVHLERGGMNLLGDVPESDCVRLPDGRVVGRRAESPGP
jgi:hypothetical protein